MSFHVPERARIRETSMGITGPEDGNNGCFVVDSIEPGWRLVIVASDGGGWEHVSIHACTTYTPLKQRTPTWKEMCFMKATFWDDDDVVMQLHPKRSEYVNTHPHTLHLWRPIDQPIPTPPIDFV